MHSDAGSTTRARRPAGRPAARLSRRPQVDRQAVHDRWALALIWLTWAWVVAPRLIQTVTAPKYLTQVGVEAPPYTGPASLALKGLTLVMLAFCVLVLLDTCRDPHPGNVGALAVLLLPWVYLVVRDLYLPVHPTRSALVYPFVVLAVWMSRPRIQVLRLVGLLVAAAAVVSIAIAVLLPAKGIYQTAGGDLANNAKEILPGGVLVGFLTQGNNLGQLLVLGLPLIAMIAQRWVRWPLLAVVSFALVWAASRSSLAAVAVALLAVVAIQVVPRAARRWAGPVVALMPFGMVAVLPLVVHDPLAFTNRGSIWTYSLLRWRQDPVFGLGGDWYDRVGRSSDRLAGSVFHGHNQMVHLLATGGLVLLALVVVQLLVVAVRAGALAAHGQVVGVVYVATLGGTCILEKSFVLIDNTSLFPVVVLPLAVLLCGVGPTGDELAPVAAAAGTRAGVPAQRRQVVGGRA